MDKDTHLIATFNGTQQNNLLFHKKGLNNTTPSKHIWFTHTQMKFYENITVNGQWNEAKILLNISIFKKMLYFSFLYEIPTNKFVCK